MRRSGSTTGFFGFSMVPPVCLCITMYQLQAGGGCQESLPVHQTAAIVMQATRTRRSATRQRHGIDVPRRQVGEQEKRAGSWRKWHFYPHRRRGLQPPPRRAREVQDQERLSLSWLKREWSFHRRHLPALSVSFTAPTVRFPVIAALIIAR